MRQSGLLVLALTGVFGVVLAPSAAADPVYKTTQVTFHEPVEIPGMVLPAGTYVIKLLDPYMDQDIVRFYNAKQDHMYAMVFAVRDYRLVPTDRTVFTFEERANNAPEAIKEWFPPFENWGEEFVYPKVKPVVAQAAATPPPAAVTPAPPAPAPPAAPITPPQTAQVPTPQPPVEIAQAQPAPAQASPAPPAPAPVHELPKTASDLPALALLGGLLVLGGALLRVRIA